MAHEMHMRDDGILSIALDGDMDKEDVATFSAAIQPFLEGASEEHPLRVLAQRNTAGRYRPAARRLFAELSSDPRLGKVAVASPSRYGRVLVGFIVKASGRDNVHFCSSKDDAVAWLQEKDRV